MRLGGLLTTLRPEKRDMLRQVRVHVQHLEDFDATPASKVGIALAYVHEWLEERDIKIREGVYARAFIPDRRCAIWTNKAIDGEGT